MFYDQDFTTEQKIEKAVWAANIFCKYRYRDWECWVIEHTATKRIVIASEASKLHRRKLSRIDTRLVTPEGIEEKITVQNELGIARYGWLEAWAIASALENQATLPSGN